MKSLLPLDYYWIAVQDFIMKTSYPYNIIISLIIILITVYYIVNKKKLDATLKNEVKSHHKNINRLIIIMISLSIFGLIGYFFYDHFYFPKPSEDVLVVAISPFYYIDESGKFGSDINTANDFKEKLEAQKDLKIKIIMLNNPIHDANDARFQGEKKGAHIVVYGETKSKIGNIGEIKYFILPLPSLNIISSMMPSQPTRTEDSNGIITVRATFSMVTEKPISIIESLTENASSVIYVIGAFEEYKKSNFTSSITFLKSIKNYENDSIILLYIANNYYFNNYLNKSIEYFDRAIDINKSFATALNNKGAALGKLRRYEEALAASSKAIEINPQYAGAWSNKGNDFLYLDRYVKALDAYDKAIELNPQFAEAWGNKGAALTKLGRYEAALATFDKAIGINPQDANAWNNKGTTLDKLGRYEEAKIAFENAYKLNPNFSVPSLSANSTNKS